MITPEQQAAREGVTFTVWRMRRHVRRVAAPPAVFCTDCGAFAVTHRCGEQNEPIEGVVR